LSKLFETVALLPASINWLGTGETEHLPPLILPVAEGERSEENIN
jgi:hypothetical protein